MKHEAQRALARALAEQASRGRRGQAQASQVEAEIYTDPARAARERALLARWPWCAGLTGSLRTPGSYRAESAGDGQGTTLLARDAQGTPRAFANACLHRGAEIAGERASESPIIRCPYHGWKYDCEGHLLGKDAGARRPRLPARAATEHAD